MKIHRNVEQQEIKSFVKNVLLNYEDLKRNFYMSMASQMNEGIYTVNNQKDMRIAISTHSSTWHPHCVYVRLAYDFKCFDERAIYFILDFLKDELKKPLFFLIDDRSSRLSELFKKRDFQLIRKTEIVNIETEKCCLENDASQKEIETVSQIVNDPALLSSLIELCKKTYTETHVDNSVAAFLEKMNSVSIQHVGYCGEEKEEIYQTLLHEFSDLDLSQSFAVAYEGESIVGALGLDIDKEDQSAEVWGPFISDEEHDASIVDKLFENVISNSSIQFTRMDFFLNKENIKGKEFVLKHGGVETGHHMVLIANRDELAEVDVNEIETYSPLYEKAFSRLHAAEFPSTYYSAQEILRRMNETNQLLIMRNDEEHIKGYVYVEAQPQHHTGSIEYIAVSNQSRKQGVGTKLVEFALAHLFSYDEIKGISLCVGNENESAINLYKEAGFKIVHELIHFKVISQGSIL